MKCDYLVSCMCYSVFRESDVAYMVPAISLESQAVLLCVLLGKEKWGGAWCKRVCRGRTAPCLSILYWEIQCIFNLLPRFKCVATLFLIFFCLLVHFSD